MDPALNTLQSFLNGFFQAEIELFLRLYDLTFDIFKFTFYLRYKMWQDLIFVSNISTNSFDNEQNLYILTLKIIKKSRKAL